MLPIIFFPLLVAPFPLIVAPVKATFKGKNMLLLRRGFFYVEIYPIGQKYGLTIQMQTH